MKRVLAILLLLATRPAFADDEIVRGNIVKVEATEIYVNLGASQAVTSGAALRIKRPIKLVHPVTKKPVQDWLPVGAAQITQTGTTLSRAVIGELVDRVRVGDIAEVLVDRPDREPVTEPKKPGTQPPPEPPPGPKVDPATAQVLAAFAAQTGQTIDARIATWEKYLSSNGGSPYAAAVRQELEALSALREQMRPPQPAGSTEIGVTIEHHAPPAAAPQHAIPLVFVLQQPDRVASAYLHYRVAGERTYRRQLLVREHDIYLRGSVLGEIVKPPGIDYFVEVSTPAGAAGLALGSPAEPLHVDVEEPPLADRFGPTPGRSALRVSAEVLDFATFDKRDGDHRDFVIAGNVDFTYRLIGAVQSVGVGYGVYSGEGGYADRSWSMEQPLPRTGFQYGYADLEVGGVQQGVPVSIGAQVIAGVGKEGFGMGVEGRLRLGSRDAANLVLSGRTIDQVGFVSDIRFGAQPIEGLGVGVSVGATNQPTGGDVGVKLGTELEYRGVEHVSLLVRASWQGRTTEHGGIGGGAGVGFSW
ncbi:MAG TPA: hypothetical protein VFQ53_01610 [Kofleriaceae bacterium]|nr:hypothetical protein [Kofleriaceae bacterium]